MAKKTTKKAAKKATKKVSGIAAKPAKRPARKSTIKTVPTAVTVESYLAKLDPTRRADCERLVEIFQSITGQPPVMWGPSIVGFGKYHYVYDSGHSGDMCVAGFSARSTALTLYILSGFDGQPDLMAKLGKYKTGKACLYIKSLDDVDLPTLKKLITASVKFVRAKYPG
jgi:hypothetical protein